MTNIFIIIPTLVIAGTPFAAFAHEGYVLNEAIAHFWGNPLALFIAAIFLGIVTGGAVYIRKKNAPLAFRWGVGVGAIIMFLLFALPGTAPSSSSLPETSQLSGAVATVYKSASCGCCGGYIEELERQGATVLVEVVDEKRLAEVKVEHGVAPEFQSCHTTIIDGYVVEGHVPIEAVAKLRAEKPAVRGITLPGMPSGTPGMPGPKFGPFEVKDLSGGAFMQI